MNWSSYDAHSVPKKSYHCANMLEHKEFKSRFSEVNISGLKGEERSLQLKEKGTNALYTVVEKRIPVFDYENEMQKCSNLSGIIYARILQLLYFTSVLTQEEHGNPYFKLTMLYENSENTLYKEMQKRAKNKDYYDDDTILYIIMASVDALAYLQKKNISHGNLTLHWFYLQKDNQLKLMANHTKKAKTLNTGKINMVKLAKEKAEIYYFSPELHKQANKKRHDEVIRVNPYKSDVFTLAMNIIHLCLLSSCTECYSAYEVDAKMLTKLLSQIQTKHSKIIFELLLQMIAMDDNKRPDFIELENIIENLKLPPPKRNLLGSAYDFKMLERKLSTPEILPQEFVNEVEERIQYALKNAKGMREKYYANGNKYYGELNKDDEPEGIGILWWANGDRYEGFWKDGMYHKDGTYYFADGVKHYGNFHRGEIHGTGVRYYQNEGIYFGDWKNGKCDGKGTFYWPNGEKYIGDFKCDGINGVGVLRWLNGWNIEGLWIDKGHGIGFAEPLENYTPSVVRTILK